MFNLQLKFLNYLTLSLFSSYEDIEYLESLLEWGEKNLLDDDFQNIINGIFEKFMKLDCRSDDSSDDRSDDSSDDSSDNIIYIRMQPIYICIIRNKLKSLKLLQEYGVQMVLNGKLENIPLINPAIQYNVDEEFLQYLFGDKRDYDHSLLKLPIGRSDMNRVIFLLDYVQITTTELNEYFKRYDREDSICKCPLDDNIKNNHIKMIKKAYVVKRVKELRDNFKYDSNSIFNKLPLEILTLIVSFYENIYEIFI